MRSFRPLLLYDAGAALFAAVAGPTLWAAFDLSYDPRSGLILWSLTLPATWFGALWLVGAYEPTAHRADGRAASLIAQALFLVAAGFLVVFFVRPFFVPRGSSLVGLAIVGPATFAARVIFDRHVRRALRRSAVVLGTDAAARRAADAIADANEGFRVVAFLADGAAPDARAREVPVIDLARGIWSTVRELGAEVILVGHTRALPPEALADLARCYEHEVETIPATAFYEELTGRVMADALEADWYADLPTRSRGFYPPVKRSVDVVLSLALGIVLSPVMAAIALATLVDSGRPVLLCQVRLGRSGRPFVVHKFRSMERDAEPEGRAIWAADRDDRATRVGRFLRERRLDELPQLWDVLRGSMSLIGPRPERPEFSEQLAVELPLYSARALVRPGITGWAQVRYPYARTMEENLAKLEYDLYYVRHFGPLLDLTITVRTVLLLLGLGGPARAA